MRHLPKLILSMVIILLAGIGSYYAAGFFIKPERSVLVNAQAVEKDDSKSAVSLVSLGDSLTEGVGDTTGRGGFVPLVATEIKDKFSLTDVTTDNFGKSGDRSDQILKRLKASAEQQKALKDADIISITVGGNDLMKTVSKNLFSGLTLKTFTKPASTYQRQLTDLVAEIRTYAPDAPIYIFGIYNPFYLYFSEITELQDIVDYWNTKTEDVTLGLDDCYFIPINDLLSKGTAGEALVEDENNADATGTLNSSNASSAAATQTSDSSATLPSTSAQESASASSNSDTRTSGTETTDGGTTTSSDEMNAALAGLITSGNDLIFDEDHFHPNNLGYQKMASALRDELIQTQGLWLKDAGK